ncbi:MAG: hypothetical protein J5548_11845 [Prevotella sp.]|nr:hypothetical protein [Prevotella sp.]
MRKSTIVSILLLALCTQTWACGGEGTNNYYMFSVFRREMMNTSLFSDQFNKFWETYTNGEHSNYMWNQDEIMEVAKKKKDTEMTTYLTQLNKYLDISQQLGETWDYPTKEQLAQRKIDLNAIITKADNYKGTRLKSQWELLRMRANMVLGNHAANITQWEQKSSKLPASAYREMMRNIYAGALLHQGQRGKACDIYAEQGDLVSIKWAMRKHRNFAGIKAIFAERPDSPTMNFLVQDFVNNVQETIDSDGDKEWVEEMIDHRVIPRNDVNSFISYAQKLVDEKKTKSPAMWMAAIGELQYLHGQYKEAMTSLNKAMEMDGTERMRDNARTIRLIASVKTARFDQAYNKWLADEFNWLIEKSKEEAKFSEDGVWNNHYYEMISRLVYDNLVPRYTAAGQTNMAAALLLMMTRNKLYNTISNHTIDNDEYLDYSSEHFDCIDKMSPAELINYKKFLQTKAQDPFEAVVKKYIDYNENYYNDLIGTAYLACDDQENAAQYLKLVPLSFIESQAIRPYTVRDYTKARWLGKQKVDEYGSPAVKSNPKLNFCNNLSTLKANYANATGEARKQAAYDLAVRYFQASHKGDCWYLTQYGVSVIDTTRADRADLIGKTVQLLEESATSSNETLKLNSLYALAYVPLDEWCEWDYDWDKNSYYISKVYTDSKQYAHLFDLHQYTKNKDRLPSYVTKCDVLKKFRSNL